MKKKLIGYVSILLFFTGFLYFGFVNSMPLTDPDETFYSETAREMLVHKSFLTPLLFEVPQFEKPPLFYWLTILSFKVSGVNTFSARLFPALFGMIGVIFTFLFLRKIFSEEISFYTSLILSTMLLYFGLSRVVLTDMVFSLFITFSLYSFFLWYEMKDEKYLRFFIIALSFAVLTKGPLGFVVSFLTISVFLFLIKDKDFDSFKVFIKNKWWIVFFVITLPWYLFMLLKYGKVFFNEFFVHDNFHRFIYAEHKNFDKWYFYPSVIIGGTLPWTIFFIFSKIDRKIKKLYLFLFSWFFSTFIFFSLAHSKLASYIFPLFPSIAIFLGISLSLSEKKQWKFYLASVLYLFLSISALFFVKSVKNINVFPAVLIFSISTFLVSISLFLKKIRYSIVLNAVGFLVYMLVSFTLIPDYIKPAYSDKYLKRYVREFNYYGKNIVCSSMYPRGIYFYTKNPVVVVSGEKQPYWSKQNLKILYKDEEIIKFFNRNKILLCVLKKSDFKRIERIFKGKRKNRILAKYMEKYVIISEKKTNKI